jgi:hypothetical protein
VEGRQGKRHLFAKEFTALAFYELFTHADPIPRANGENIHPTNSSAHGP